VLVVSDSSPLNFLIRLRCQEVLPALFARVLIPPVVQGELNRTSTPLMVRSFMASMPDWLTACGESHAACNRPRLPHGCVAAARRRAAGIRLRGGSLPCGSGLGFGDAALSPQAANASSTGASPR